MADQVHVHFEPTPNPQSLKFVVDRAIASDSAEFKQGEPLFRSPLAKKLFGFPWTQNVFIGRDFVTVTKQEWVDWETLAEPLSGLIAEHIESGAVVLTETEATTTEANDSATVQTIKRILNEEIRPAVAMDGGDVVFHKYEDEIVYLFMQGSCAGCPSSTYTLKEGITTRLRNAVPEIKDVVAVNA